MKNSFRVVTQFVIFIVFAISATAQTEKFDIASFTPPKGWQRIDSNNVLIFHNSRPVNNGIVFCQIFIIPSRASSNTPAKNFNDDWNNLVAKNTSTTAKPQTETEKTPDGWTVVKGFANVTLQGISYSCILATISGFGRTMSIMVNVGGQGYLPEIEAFLNSFELDSKAGAGGNAPSQSLPTSFDWNNYSYAAPPRWQTFKTNQSIMISQTPNIQEGCVITILPPIQSSGNLETDARSIFNQMYPGWGYRFTGEKREDVIKGFTHQGLEYCMIQARMSRMRPDGFYYDYEDGIAWVIGLGKQIVVVTGRHERLISCMCHHHYENWGRFFNSFAVKNQPASPNAQQDPAKRILGDWMALGSTALTEYIFAANGNYQFIGVGGSTVTRSDAYNDYIYIKTSSFTGDGSYSVKNNQLTLEGRGGKPEQIPIRFDKVNHGGTGWKDRIYMRKISTGDGKEYEVCYEKVK